MSTNNNINSFAENMRKTIAQQTNELSLLSAMQRSLTTMILSLLMNIKIHRGKIQDISYQVMHLLLID